MILAEMTEANIDHLINAGVFILAPLTLAVVAYLKARSIEKKVDAGVIKTEEAAKELAAKTEDVAKKLEVKTDEQTKVLSQQVQQTQVAVEQVHGLTNSMKDALVSASRAEGKAEGIESERNRP